ncbi:transposase [Candidatus Mesenet endosymbiont of Phosphuga atrata]|uniref:transposase n=1 Tax=Candidatus Mesenet endosymbiont of Phosphuga atrata TaxID=3066221 RepID=UPI003977C3FF
MFTEKPAFKKKRISIIGALNHGKVGTPCAFEGYCNSELFEVYIKNILVPELKTGQSLIMQAFISP